MKWSTLTLFTILTQWSNAQNFVLNPDFENTNGTFCGIMAGGDFSSTMQDWDTPTQGTADLLFTNIASSCWNFQPNSTYGGPIGLKGPQIPRSGDVMAGIFLYTLPGFDQREYIQVPLSSSLTVGGRYIIECYVSLADYTEFATDQLGIYLSTQPVSLPSDGVLNYTPQVLASGVISDTQGWVRVADTLIATDSYAYLTIGNFSSDAQTPTTVNPTASFEPGTYGAYYFVDDVSVERYIDTAALANNELIESQVSVFPNPFTDQIKIELPETGSAFDIELYNPEGKLLFINKDVMSQLEISMSEFPAGVYILTIRNDENVITRRIVK
jgi:Secretion system C-terminal sorting domain